MQLAQVVTRAAGQRTVKEVRVKIGALRQVVPETLAYAWQFVPKAANLTDAELDIEWVPAVVECPQGHRTQLGHELGFSCPTCAAPARLISGEEFTVIDIEVEGEAQ